MLSVFRTPLSKKRCRGLASGGRTNGRGNNGQNARSGGHLPHGFEGGQTPFHLTVPKRGHHNPYQQHPTLVNLERVQHLIDTGRLDAEKPITMFHLRKAGIDIKDGVKILGRVLQTDYIDCREQRIFRVK
ncbi:50S ribosomal protein L15 [Paramicrosporidium saccamoebae]|uniref:50S ribosomal protein L15 n=1 Tax=Paramicrosporidium saccamoebae TaxID=1246581 RepID=A0A2H9TGR7_9FUNG|nr:50S ribosomal protein L15 [Paramicrosporidium saccamoebae]